MQAVIVIVMSLDLGDKMNYIETTAPISIELLKEYFQNKDLKFLIDYENSKLQGMKMLTYLSNIDIPSDIKMTMDGERFYDLLREYLNLPILVNVEMLERVVIDILLHKKNLIKIVDQNIDNFIDENKDILNKWENMLDSLILFNLYTVKEKFFSDWVETFPKVETLDPVGINFVNLLKYDDFYIFYQNTDLSKIKFYQRLFDEYIFKGKNLYSFWAQENNPMYLLTFGIANGIVDGHTVIE
jgi:hypothetical protein